MGVVVIDAVLLYDTFPSWICLFDNSSPGNAT